MRGPKIDRRKKTTENEPRDDTAGAADASDAASAAALRVLGTGPGSMTLMDGFNIADTSNCAPPWPGCVLSDRLLSLSSLPKMQPAECNCKF